MLEYKTFACMSEIRDSQVHIINLTYYSIYHEIVLLFRLDLENLWKSIVI